jgi:hypothetical protein
MVQWAATDIVRRVSFGHKKDRRERGAEKATGAQESQPRDLDHGKEDRGGLSDG